MMVAVWHHIGLLLLWWSVIVQLCCSQARCCWWRFGCCLFNAFIQPIKQEKGWNVSVRSIWGSTCTALTVCFPLTYLSWMPSFLIKVGQGPHSLAPLCTVQTEKRCACKHSVQQSLQRVRHLHFAPFVVPVLRFLRVTSNASARRKLG